MAHSLSPQPEQPRRVSFSNELPRLQMPEGRSITPARRAYHRSPFPAANETVDYFDDNTSSTPSQPETPTSPDSLHSMHIKHDSIGDPFMGDSTDPPITPPRTLPRLDFAESTPIISRGTFTPRPIRQSYSPSRVLGRQISLQNLAATDDGGSSEDEFEDALESFHSSTSVIIETDVAREAVGGTDSRVVELSADDAAVELELDLGGLSLGQSSVAVNEMPQVTEVPSAIDLESDGEESFLSTSPGLDPRPEVEIDSPAHSTPVIRSPDVDVPSSPGASFQIISPLPSPTKLTSSGPSTHARGSTGYDTDESEGWVPRQRAVRRIVVSDDEDESSPPRSKSTGMRGRVPAAIARLNAADSEEEVGAVEIGDASYDYDQDESAGSLRDFIVESDYEEEIADGDDDTEVEFGGDSLPMDDNGVPIIDLVSDSEDSQDDSPVPIDAGDTLHFTPPPPPISLPDMDQLSLGTPSKPTRTPLGPSRTVKKAHMSNREWSDHRERYAQKLFNELDSRVFGSRLSKCGTKLEWGARLRTTAGQAHRSKQRHRDGTVTNTYKIVLSNKVLSTDSQIRDTLAHEMCHLACWVISNEHQNPHGLVFKSWGSKVHAARPDIIVTTKHSYVINFKYEWRCSSPSCAKVYRRHSKSIDTTKQVCGACRSRLEPLFASKASNPFQDFLKDNMKAAKLALPGAKHGDVMRALSKRWAEAQTASKSEHDAYWRSLAA